jgi:hypothetical protein
MIDDNFALVHIDVLEQGERKTTVENAGGVDLMKEYGGEKSGLPFYAFLDAKGAKIADSNAMPKGMNIGYPGSPEEISAFMDLIKKTAPKLSEADREKLKMYLLDNAPKPAGGH